MRHIDKNILRDEFDRYTRMYLREAWCEDTFEFSPKLASKTSYDCFSKKKYKFGTGKDGDNGWLDVLMREQNSLCCYCMRRIKADEVSVEHLVPESADNLSDEFEFYGSMAPYLKSFVITGSEFDSIAADVDIDTHTRMPHLIAHGNLFSACSSQKPGCSCNNKRGNKRIIPFMLMEDAEKFISYDEEGKMILLHEDNKMAEATLVNLNINTDTLKQIRHMWCLFARNDIHPDLDRTYDLMEKDKIIRKALGLGIDDVIQYEYQKFLLPDSKEYYWNLLLKYEWFWDYYRNRQA